MWTKKQKLKTKNSGLPRRQESERQDIRTRPPQCRVKTQPIKKSRPAGRVPSPGGSAEIERFNKSGSMDGKSAGSFREVLDGGSPLPLF